MRVPDGTPSAPTLTGAGATEQRLIDGMNSSRDGEAVLTCPGEVKASVGFQRHPRPSRARAALNPWQLGDLLVLLKGDYGRSGSSLPGNVVRGRGADAFSDEGSVERP